MLQKRTFKDSAEERGNTKDVWAISSVALQLFPRFSS